MSGDEGIQKVCGRIILCYQLTWRGDKQIYTSGSYPDADVTNGYHNGYYPSWGGYYTVSNAIYVAPTIMNTSTPATMRPRTLPPYGASLRVRMSGSSQK